MRPVRKVLGFIVVLALVAAFPTTVLAAGATPAGWPGGQVQAAFLGLLVPLALILLAVGAAPPDEAVEVVGSALTALVAGVLAYAACGFALAFGGLGLQLNWPGLSGLVAEWSPLDPSFGLGWGALGLTGWGLSGAAGTPDALTLAAVQLPLVMVSVLIPTLALARRATRGALVGMAVVMGGFLYPLITNWTWGGGWLSMLGLNLGWGHGFVDLGGSMTLHALGAGVALAGVLVLGRNRPVRRATSYIELPPVHFPLFVLVGGLLAPAGWLGLVLANPLLPLDLQPGVVAVNLLLGACGGAAPGLFYSWLATGRIDPQLAARGLISGLVAVSAGCGFMPPWAAVAAGLVVGVLLPVLLYSVEHGLRWHDPNAILVTHGVAGILGTLWLALFADGRWGIGWNGVSSPLGEAQQGIAGLVVAPGLLPDVPGQLWAQLAGLAAVLVFAVGLPLLLYGLVQGVYGLYRLVAMRSREAALRSGRR